MTDKDRTAGQFLESWHRDRKSEKAISSDDLDIGLRRGLVLLRERNTTGCRANVTSINYRCVHLMKIGTFCFASQKWYVSRAISPTTFLDGPSRIQIGPLSPVEWIVPTRQDCRPFCCKQWPWTGDQPIRQETGQQCVLTFCGVALLVFC